VKSVDEKVKWSGRLQQETLFQAVHRQATTASIQELAGLLGEVLSRRLTAYIAGVRDGKTATRWANGEVTNVRDCSVEQRLPTAYEIVQLLTVAQVVKSQKCLLSRSHIYKTIRLDTFPCIRLGE
jgi:hypothetical protein